MPIQLYTVGGSAQVGRQALRLGLGRPGQAEAAILAGHARIYPPKMPGVAWEGS